MTNQDKLITLREAAERIGVSYMTACRRAKEGRLPGAIRIGGTTVVDSRVLERYVKAVSRVSTLEQA